MCALFPPFSRGLKPRSVPLDPVSRLVSPAVDASSLFVSSPCDSVSLVSPQLSLVLISIRAQVRGPCCCCCCCWRSCRRSLLSCERSSNFICFLSHLLFSLPHCCSTSTSPSWHLPLHSLSPSALDSRANLIGNPGRDGTQVLSRRRQHLRLRRLVPQLRRGDRGSASKGAQGDRQDPEPRSPEPRADVPGS